MARRGYAVKAKSSIGHIGQDSGEVCGTKLPDPSAIAGIPSPKQGHGGDSASGTVYSQSVYLPAAAFEKCAPAVNKLIGFNLGRKLLLKSSTQVFRFALFLLKFCYFIFQRLKLAENKRKVLS
jgi:hypothetical protein